MRALVLGGGGAKVQYQIGALKHILCELKIHYDIVCGVSSGALVAVHLAQFKKGEEEEAFKSLEKVFANITTRDIWKDWTPFKKLHGIWRSSFLDATPLKALVEKNLDETLVASSGKILRIGATSLNTGKLVLFTEQDIDLKAKVFASAAYPVAFEPVQINNHLLIDGGVTSVAPVNAAIDAGATQIDVILVSPKDIPETKFMNDPTAVTVGTRTIEIMLGHLADQELKDALMVNRLVKAGAEGYKRFIEFNVIRSSEHVAKFTLHFSPRDAERLRQAGYKDAVKVFSLTA